MIEIGNAVLPENMTEQEVKDLMKSSKSEKEWNDNCDSVKKTCGGYPEFWYETVILSGLLNKTRVSNWW